MSLDRIAAIVRADFLLRFRRVSTVVTFLLLSAFAYVWVPDPSTGRTLLQIEGKRALYNSAAIGMGTASLASVFIGLFGYYVISNALRHDLRSRCGYILASTPMRSMEYIVGKFAGNVLFLSTFMAGFMVSSMAMLLVRAEAPLEPLVFIGQYLLIVPQSIVFVSTIAILFESIPWLSGRFGDVAYFFVWALALGSVAALIEQSGSQVARYFDFTGMSFMITELKHLSPSGHISIGASNFDKAAGVYVFQGLSLSAGWLAPRIGSLLIPLPLLFVARLFFHRFDPARVKASAVKGKRNFLALLNAPFKPFARILFVAGRPGGGSLFAAARTDALMTVTSLPLAIAAIVGISIGSLSAGRAVLPIAFAALAIVLADVASREKRNGMTGLVFAAPLLKSRFVLWKFFASLLLGVAFLIVPLITSTPTALPALIVGIITIAAAATSLGIVSGNPKTFIVLFLTFWYVVVNDRGGNPALDFAGMYGTATPFVLAAYALVAVLFLATAEAYHRWELRTRW